MDSVQYLWNITDKKGRVFAQQIQKRMANVPFLTCHSCNTRDHHYRNVPSRGYFDLLRSATWSLRKGTEKIIRVGTGEDDLIKIKRRCIGRWEGRWLIGGSKFDWKRNFNCFVCEKTQLVEFFIGRRVLYHGEQKDFGTATEAQATGLPDY